MRLIISPYWCDFFLSLSLDTIVDSDVVVVCGSKIESAKIVLPELFFQYNVKFKYLNVTQPSKRWRKNEGSTWWFVDDVTFEIAGKLESLDLDKYNEIYVPAGYIHPFHLLIANVCVHVMNIKSKVVYANRPYYDLLKNNIQYNTHKDLKWIYEKWISNWSSNIMPYFPWGGGPVAVNLYNWKRRGKLVPFDIAYDMIKFVEEKSFVLRKSDDEWSYVWGG